MDRNLRSTTVAFLLVYLLFSPAVSHSAQPAGEIFGKPISRDAFNFAMKTVNIFSISEKQAVSSAAKRAEVWQHMIFLEEAERRGLKVSREELEKELARLLQEKDIKYGSFRYFTWIETTFGEKSDVFEKRLENLLKVKKLIASVKSGTPAATETQTALNDILTKAALKDLITDLVLAMETSRGTIELKLYTELAPKACENFQRLAEKGYYDGLTFHRVIKGFMIQGGDPNGDGTGGESIWREKFEDEVYSDVRFDKKGLLAMANAGPNTNGSQFFITLGTPQHLNMKHTIFGEVVSGLDVVEKIGATPVDGDDRPLEKQTILHVTVKK